MRMWGYQQAHRVYEPKNKGMWGYEVPSKHTRTWGYEDAGMQGRENEPEDMRM